MEHEYDYLIVGAGMTGDAAAKALRKADADASVGMLGDESDGPYERPPLSKGLWKDDADPASVDLDTAAAGVDVHAGRRVVSVDSTDRSVEDDQGDTWRYRRLLLATGATPRRFSLPEHDRVIAYRTLADYRRLRELAKSGTNVVVVGGGFIGSELAASLAGVGCKVTMVFPEDAIGSARFSDGLADFLNDYYRKHDVTLRTGVSVEGGQADDEGVTLSLSGGESLRADVVVAGLGVTPNVELAESAGLDVDNGIVVDEHLRTSDSDIWAAGDVANFHNPALGQRLRVEHENAAIDMGTLAGKSMAGADDTYDTLPFFYSDLFDLGYEAVGLLDSRLEIFEDWNEPYREGVVYYLDAGRVRGVLLWNTWGQVEVARKLIARPGPIDMESLRGRIPGMM
ncbi:MAG TPA: FAD-dependent oxidoreductase [Oleiagrimonas sp.]|nr:FAD-dependent oxidoreductase [Oleiagrimonas sp.]